jgi:hypothetical protein
MQNLVNFEQRECHYFEFQIWKLENLEKKPEKWHGPLASGPRWPMATCPGQRVPTRVRRHRGVSVTARHLTPALSTVPPAFRPPRTAQVAAARVHRLAPYPRAAVVQRRNQFLSSPS